MAEVVASVIGITTFGVKLVDTLYDFGCNVSSAREQSSRIGDRIDDYITILDILAGLLEEETALISDKANSMVDKLCDQSEDLFYDIYDLLPRRKDDGKVAWMDRIAWNFRKPKVEMLLGQIEYIKSNVLLLVMTTRKKNKSKNAKDSELQHHTKRAQNAIVQHMNAGDKLAALEKDLEQSDAAASACQDNSTAVVKSTGHTAVILLSRQVEAISRFQNAMISMDDASQRQSYVMEQSPTLLKELLEEWTSIVALDELPVLSQSNGNTLRLESGLGDIQVEEVAPAIDTERPPLTLEDGTTVYDLPDRSYRAGNGAWRPPPRNQQPSRRATDQQPTPRPTEMPWSQDGEVAGAASLRVHAIFQILETTWKPSVASFVHMAPSDPESCQREYTRLCEGIMANVILPADSLGILDGDYEARKERKKVIAEAQAQLRRLDTKMGYWRKS